MPNPLVWIAKKGAGKLVGDKVGQKINEPYDPLYEMRPNTCGKLKRVTRPIPDYLSPADQALLLKIRKWAARLDTSHSILGMRFGWSSIIGLVPELGDIVDALLALYVYHLCKKLDGGLDVKTKAKMKAWIVLDAVVGLIPLLGDLVDASIKCNARNCKLVEEFLAKKHGPSTKPAIAEGGKTSAPHSVQGLLLPSKSKPTLHAASPPLAAVPQPTKTSDF